MMNDGHDFMNDGEMTSAEVDQATISLSRLSDGMTGSSGPRRADREGLSGDPSGIDLYAGLTSLGFIQAALRRSAALWCTMAIIGLLAGVGLLHVLPAEQEATSQLYLTQPPNAPLNWILDDQTIAQSHTVAAMAIHALGLQVSPASLVKDYTVAAVGNRVLLITVKAQSDTDAVNVANAIAGAFLRYQTILLTKQEQLVDASLQKQLAQAQSRVTSLGGKIAALSAGSPPSAGSSNLTRLKAERSAAIRALTNLRQAVNSAQSTERTATTTTLTGSVALDPGAVVKTSAKKRIALFVGGGLIAGLLIGVGIVVLRALLSNRLRRRDEVARALGAPVLLSVGRVRLSRRRLKRHGLDAASAAPVRRIIAQVLEMTVLSPDGPNSVVVVPVGDPSVAALCLVSLATSCAIQGLGVVLADLCPGAPAAGLAGAPQASGVQSVSVSDTQFTIAVPESEDLPPAGPFDPDGTRTDERLIDAVGSADVMLTLAALDPAVGGDYLAGWAREAVVVVTAGQSSAAAVRAVGEMLRLAEMTGISAVLVGADKSDESLGTSRWLKSPKSVSASLPADLDDREFSELKQSVGGN